jgi:hypothetical protein
LGYKPEQGYYRTVQKRKDSQTRPWQRSRDWFGEAYEV